MANYNVNSSSTNTNSKEYNEHNVSPYGDGLSSTKSRLNSPLIGDGNVIVNSLDGSASSLSSSSADMFNNKNQTKKAMSLPRKDRPQFLILVLLYLIQGIPIGLSFGSIPYILKSSNLSYSQIGIFTLASYPYSFKLIYSPIVDSIFSKKIGRRKSWIIPVQFLSGITLILLGLRIEKLFDDIEKNLYDITFAFFTLILLCATQDIAVDGWALTILSKNALSYASTAQTVGLNIGYFLSFTIFLTFNSPEFANKYLRKIPKDYGLISLKQYLIFWGFFFILITIIITLFVPENPLKENINLKNDDSNKRNDDIELNTMDMNIVPITTANNTDGTNINSTIGHEELSPIESLKAVYKKMYNVVKLHNVKIFIILHLISKIGFQANEAATNLKLLEKGFSKEDLAITVLIDFPFEIIFGYYAGHWSSGVEPLKPWLLAFLGRLIAAFAGQFLIIAFPKSGEINGVYFILVILQHLLGSFMSTIQFVSICAFHTRIADPLIGGTYMTTLNTLSNLGGQWPKLVVLYMIDKLTKGECISADVSAVQTTNPFINEPYYNCNTATLKKQCVDNGGDCISLRDGYYFTNMLCVCIGILTYFLWIKKTAKYLEKLPASAWRVKK
ncbi:hypothetical protein PACTADRAFT_51218 [Pachysolen tannophilus NRRL Y-2460]|uniref:Major facilitator superfamily (MFS) profile domain-containing protein n=1 Tax=Pachysolen tannophilus NRRL Y-2460 TaxID=669874 RepID=A0A1E4TRL3_PACTA|nr:hypothetical protein PACTADRAFT_51218 [Pachysolen tannophilus NRRL Y-2460]